jgi:hypothetical protein
MAPVGNTFYQSSSLDPGVGYPMYYWNQTNTGLIYIRNAADTAWVLVGDSAQPNLGQLSTQGGNMNGAITGAHGLSPQATNNFSTLSIGGLNVPTQAYVDNLFAALNANMASSISSALGSVQGLNIASKVAKNRGTWVASGASSPGNTIALPQYSDGVMATEAECVWGAWIQKFTHGEFTTNNTIANVTETSNRVYTIEVYYAGGPTYFGITAGWFIVGFRSN